MNTKSLQAVIDGIGRGEVIRPPKADEILVLDAEFLRTVLIGGDIVMNGARRTTRCTLTAAGITLDGSGDDPGEHRIVIRASGPDGVVDLSKLCSPDGSALPPLIFKNCVIDRELDLQGSHVAALSLINCRLRRLRADGCQIDGGCELAGLRGLEGTPFALCQVRMVSARIDGSLDLRNSHLRSERKRPALRAAVARTFADGFALSLASSEIAGRLLLTDDFKALGGVSLYQADIRNSVRITNATLQAWFGVDKALDAAELKLGGSFIWEGDRIEHGPDDPPPPWNIAGAAIFRRASIGGDLLIRNCVWRQDSKSGRLGRQAHGGIDLRLSRVGGQLRMWGHCVVARRIDVPAGLAGKPYADGVRDETIGPALDAWKATFGGGVRLEAKCLFHGAVRLNACSIQRKVYFGSRVQTPAMPAPVRRYHPALDLSDSRLDGYLVVATEEIIGKVDFQRLRLVGALEIRKLRLGAGGAPVLPAGRHPAPSLETASILDFQDLDLQGGINLFKVALMPEAGDPIHIVDLRGMRCDAYDDAEGRCWQGLNPKSPGRWRLRFEGLAFTRLERSDRDDVADDPAGHPSGQPAIDQRVRGLRSFFENRPRPALDGWPKAWAWLANWFREPTAEQREAERFSAQIYETFAKAYLMRGDIASGVGMIEARSDVQWILRTRAVTRRWKPLMLWSCIVYLIALAATHATDMPAAGGLALSAAMIVLIAPPLVVATTGACFKFGFGYGLKPFRALMTFALMVMLGWIAISVFQTQIAWTDEGAANISDRLLYAFDMMLPVDLHQDKFKLQPSHHILRFGLATYETVGWVVSALTAVTISGLLKRDVER